VLVQYVAYILNVTTRLTYGLESEHSSSHIREVRHIVIYIPDPPQSFTSYTHNHSTQSFMQLKYLQRRNMLILLNASSQLTPRTNSVILAFNLNWSTREKRTHRLRFAFASCLV